MCFTAPAPNRLWVTDLTVIPTSEGPLWLSAIHDAFSRPGQLIHHADHGCQYTSIKLTTRLIWAGIEASMGSVGNSYDAVHARTLGIDITAAVAVAVAVNWQRAAAGDWAAYAAEVSRRTSPQPPVQEPGVPT
ncbi:hypothetical protein [Streptomyces sp. NPDC002671]